MVDYKVRSFVVSVGSKRNNPLKQGLRSPGNFPKTEFQGLFGTRSV